MDVAQLHVTSHLAAKDQGWYEYTPRRDVMFASCLRNSKGAIPGDRPLAWAALRQILESIGKQATILKSGDWRNRALNRGGEL
jgi:hypothetical protein